MRVRVRGESDALLIEVANDGADASGRLAGHGAATAFAACESRLPRSAGRGNGLPAGGGWGSGASLPRARRPAPGT